MNAHTERIQAIQLGARSLLAFALEPQAPLEGWLDSLDEWLVRSPNFFAAKPVVLQMGGMDVPLKAYRDFLGQLARRHIRVMAVENANPLLVGPHLPPVITGGRQASAERLFETPAAPEAPAPVSAPGPVTPTTFFHEGVLRSGQQIVHLEGDVVVVGRVASGAEIVAGGSVHILGGLQGRVFAGVVGGSEARIFCREARAEFLCIGEAFVTAEDMDSKLEGQAVEARLDGGRVRIRALNMKGI